MKTLPVALVVAVALAARAEAQQFPARSGDRGILDVPDAEVMGAGGGILAAELRLDRVSGAPVELGPLPLYVVAGIARTLDAGFTMRESGQPGDPRPGRVLFGGAAKLQLWPPLGPIPGAALSVQADRVNHGAVLGTRLAVSTGTVGLLRFAAIAGVETRVKLAGVGATAGLAATAALPYGSELAAEALTGPRGELFGLAFRWEAARGVGMSLGLNFVPREDAYRLSLGFAFRQERKQVPGAGVAQGPAQPSAQPEEEPSAGAPTGDRPRFALRIRSSTAATRGEPRPLQHAPIARRGPAAAATAAPAQGAPPEPIRPAAPSLEDVTEAQLREQEGVADAREKRVRSTSEQLDGRESVSQAEARKLEARESALAQVEQQLEARERRLPAKTPPAPELRQLESQEAQSAAQERQLSAIDRSYGPAIDAAQGREREAGAREDASRDEAGRLASGAAAAATRALQLDLRKQAIAARGGQLAALEARLVAKGERLDALESQLRTRSERLDAFDRRLATRGQRLDALERKPEPKALVAAPAAPAAKAAEHGGTPPAENRPVFVMVVKSPTAVVKERGAAPAAAAVAVQASGAIEKAVVAAAIVMFPSPATTLSELDREGIENIARLAAKEDREVLVWARAKDATLMAEAQRRAGEIQAQVVAAGPLDAKKVVTRITTRPGAQGVDVVVSALRETAKPTAAAPAKAQAARTLDPGEAGKRQIREVIVAVQPSIEACVGEELERRHLQRAEGTLDLTVSAQGRVTRLKTGGGDLAGSDLEICLTKASAAWTFPSSDGEYAVDVPITVMRGGAR